MGLTPGDVVVKADNDPRGRRMKEMLGDRWESFADSREFEVSSSREDGQVYFKGGGEQAPSDARLPK